MKAILFTPLLIFSSILQAAASTIVVDNTVDPGDGVCASPGCTLREAITAANANPGPDIINFNIPVAGVQTITPTSGLPTITETVTIDGYTQPGASENTLEVGNDAVLLIELDGTVTAPFTHGLTLNCDNSVVRGLTINRFTDSGIVLFSGMGNVIEGNFIGTDADGTGNLGNSGSAGVLLNDDDGDFIGGLLPAARNVIAGNEGAGIQFANGASGNTIQGNYIGTDRNGLVAIPNGASGVHLANDGSMQPDNVIGGTAEGAGNVISGNDNNGLVIGSSGTGTVVQGNFIGVDAIGSGALKNELAGVSLEHGTVDNTVGGTIAEARNIISANSTGVLLSGGATNNSVQGNYIGTDVTGTVDLAADDIEGVKIDDSPANFIGGSVPGAGNLISGNFNNIVIDGDASTGNLIQGNFIGTDVTGAVGLDFFGTGILILGGSGTIVGGPTGSGNVIAFNGANGGVAVISGSSGNQIFGNSIFGNLGIGINLVGGTEDASTGVTANDFPDSDVGANNLQNYPALEQITLDGKTRSVEGSLASNPNTDYVLNFYSNREVDDSGYGEGETWLGSLSAHTSAQSTADFSFPIEIGSFGRFITATATDPEGNTSEFSLASELVPPLNRFLNISTRLKVQTNDNVLIGGFIIDGTDPKPVIVRAIGPSLGGFGIDDFLANPTLELHYPDGTTVVTNDDWRDDQESEIMATGLAPTDDLEAAIVATLEPGAYTAIVSGINGGTGIGLVETYDLDQSVDSSLANISTRGLVETGDNVMIGGIIVGPESAPSGSILLRAIGPSLGDFGISNPLADPFLELRDINGALVMSNDNWKASQQTAIEETGLAPNDDNESAILATLVAGNYTAIVRGAGDTTGVGLVEAYHLD